MKRRKKVWVVVGPQGGLNEPHVYLYRMDALDEADRSGCLGFPLRVVPAILEYEAPKKEKTK